MDAPATKSSHSKSVPHPKDSWTLIENRAGPTLIQHLFAGLIEMFIKQLTHERTVQRAVSHLLVLSSPSSVIYGNDPRARFRNSNRLWLNKTSWQLTYIYVCEDHESWMRFHKSRISVPFHYRNIRSAQGTFSVAAHTNWLRNPSISNSLNLMILIENYRFWCSFIP
jgi:hypothetical protein